MVPIKSYLAQVWRAETATVSTGGEVVVRRNGELPLLIYIAWICNNLRETIYKLMMLEDGLNEEHIGITNYLQLTPANSNTSVIHNEHLSMQEAWEQLTHAKT